MGSISENHTRVRGRGSTGVILPIILPYCFVREHTVVFNIRIDVFKLQLFDNDVLSLVPRLLSFLILTTR